MGVWQYNGYVYEFFSGRAHAADAARLNVGDAIKWAIIRWGCAQGHRTYDLAGVIPEPTTSKETGIFAFKEKWGGEMAYADAAVKRVLRATNEFASRTPLVNPRNGIIIGIVAEKSATP